MRSRFFLWVKGSSRRARRRNGRAPLSGSSRPPASTAVVPGFDGARAPSVPSEGIHPKIAKAVQRAKTEDRPSVPTVQVAGALCSRQGKVSGRKVRKAPLRNARVRLNG